MATKKNFFVALKEKDGAPRETEAITCGMTTRDFKQVLLKHFHCEAINICLLQVFDEKSSLAFYAMGVKTNTSGWLIRKVGDDASLYLIPADSEYTVCETDVVRFYLNKDSFFTFGIKNEELVLAGHYKQVIDDSGEFELLPRELNN